ncbi:MAG: DUF4333 domain-containing protein [Actinobacteria bacterium]|nr:DUF4333 domain-containing protein [Actinomycetota bacterium]MCB9412690.1 DUF4333 domain-containing protein [Actinomycetota bacterium]
MGTETGIEPHRRRNALVVLAASGGALAILAGCSVSSNLDSAKLQDQITQEVQAVVPEGTEVSVSCPSDIAISAGATSECTMNVAGQTAQVVVTQEDSEGNVVFESASAILFLDQAQDEITKEVTAQIPGNWTTTCAPPGSSSGIYVAPPGTTFDCVVSGTTAGGEQQEGTAVVTVDDNKGNISFSVQ